MFKAVVFAAVSTKAQVDGVSLDDQVSKSRGWINQHDAVEIHAPLIVPGESRDYVSVRDAEREIPELATLFDLAQTKTINLVVMYNLNRFRRIMGQVYDTLAMYGCQLYSLTQPVELQPPDKFTYYASDAPSMNVGLNSMMSNTEIANLQRRFWTGMPSRVLEKGLPWHKIPYGYAKPDGEKFNRKAVPVQVVGECAVLLRIKQEYMAGASSREIAERLSADGIPSPSGNDTWHLSMILKLVTNPFYAGMVHYGRDKSRRDPRTGKRVRINTESTMVMAPGKHVAIWTVEEWEAICARRIEVANNNIGKTKNTQRLSRLLVCGECGQHLQVQRYRGRGPYYKCRKGHGHAHASEKTMLDQLRLELEEMAKQYIPEPDMSYVTLNPGGVSSEQIDAELGALVESKARYQRAYGDGVLSYEDLKLRMSELEALQREVKARQGLVKESEKERKRSRERQTLLQEFVSGFDEYLAAPPAMMNAELGKIIRHVTVKGNKIIEITT